MSLNHYRLSINPRGAYLSNRVLGVGAYSRGGLVREWWLNRSFTVGKYVGILPTTHVIFIIREKLQKYDFYILIVFYYDHRNFFQRCYKKSHTSRKNIH